MFHFVVSLCHFELEAVLYGVLRGHVGEMLDSRKFKLFL